MRCTLIVLLCVTLFGAWGLESSGNQNGPGRVIVIGMDGMDPVLLQRMMNADMMPNFSKLAQMGGFKPLATSMPPQSPVAWANVISGGEPGGHEIYDFIHRDPNPGIEGLAISPYLSTSSTERSGKSGLGLGLLLAGLLVATVIFVGGL
ncbi:MAG: alkaline phosphatase family protein, partial [Pirellulaceae bacterium]|nr:alkaline phosphatase family protein [Pirellulaceae bacterium]